MSTRREAIGAMMAIGASVPLARAEGQTSVAGTVRQRHASAPHWGKGIEGQRRADLGNGTYLNPIMAGAYADPSILRDGRDYYMTFSSFDADPGLLLWHSTDLVNWTPLTAVLPEPVGSVFAVDLVKHRGRYFLYIPMVPAPWSTLKENSIFVIHSDRIDGGWSRPIDLGIRGRIDPGHAVGEDGRRYLFLSGGYRVRLSVDGLSTDGPVEKVYDGWKYPDDWVVEAYALEGPKITRRGDYFYMVSAVGGTGGPPTGHMVIVARSRSIHGPWENCPHNPIVRTTDAGQAWWSRGHATMVEGPAGDWWMVYHGYENGFRTLGRQTLLQPFAWSADGWPVPQGGDLGQPLPKPRGGRAGPHGIARSDDFRKSAFGTRWVFQSRSADDHGRARVEDGSLMLRARGTGPDDSAPLTNLAGDHSYRVSVRVDLEDAATGGLLLYLSSRLFLGIGINGERLVTYAGGRTHYWREPAPATRTMYLRIENREHIITFYYSTDGTNWQRHGLRMESSGYNANTLLPGEGESLRPAIFSSGKGAVRFRDYRYEAL